MNAKLLMMSCVVIVLLGPSLRSAWADDEHGHSMRHGGHEAATHHGSTGHYLRHLLRHAKEIGLTADQVAKLKTIQLDLNRTRIKTEAEIQVAELEMAALAEDEKADLAAIEAKVKQSEMLEVGLRMAAIKAKREAQALLTPAQREKEQAEHEKMMRQMMRQRGGGMSGGMGGGMMGGGMMEGMGGGMMGGGEHGGPPPAQPKKEEHPH
jgi:periplasmic protein CpxP/Spy